MVTKGRIVSSRKEIPTTQKSTISHAIEEVDYMNEPIATDDDLSVNPDDKKKPIIAVSEQETEGLSALVGYEGCETELQLLADMLQNKSNMK